MQGDAENPLKSKRNLNITIMAFSWFTRNGVADPTLPSSYTLVAGVPSCMGNNQVCAINAFVVTPGNTPQIDEPLKDDIIRALDSRASSSNVKLKT